MSGFAKCSKPKILWSLRLLVVLCLLLVSQFALPHNASAGVTLRRMISTGLMGGWGRTGRLSRTGGWRSPPSRWPGRPGR